VYARLIEMHVVLAASQFLNCVPSKNGEHANEGKPCLRRERIVLFQRFPASPSSLPESGTLQTTNSGNSAGYMSSAPSPRRIRDQRLRVHFPAPIRRKLAGSLISS